MSCDCHDSRIERQLSRLWSNSVFALSRSSDDMCDSLGGGEGGREGGREGGGREGREGREGRGGEGGRRK